jgi:hypothetical protein
MQITTIYCDISDREWVDWGDIGEQGYYCVAEKDIRELNPTVIDEGAVLVYLVSGNFYNQLPYVEANQGYIRTVRYDLHYDAQRKMGKIGFIVEDSDFQTINPPFRGKVTFKIVIIK